MSFVSHLECAHCQKIYSARAIQGLCEACQKPLWVRYDLDEIKRHVSPRTLAGRPPTIWRYLELLPVEDVANIVSLVETMTPVLPARRLAADLGVKHLMIKDESRLPTGSFKARGMAVAISKAKELGITKVAVPTAGNAGGALAAYAARAGLEAWVLMPEDTPVINRKECLLAGAHTFLVNGLITDCGRLVREGRDPMGWFDVSTLKEPYRIEGKKTMGLELAEQFDWTLPDVILYPTGGGTGLIGMWKAFAELAGLGWLKDAKKPRMISCQSDGCAPIADAFSRGDRFAKQAAHPATVASGIRVPAAVGDFMILDAVRESGGVAACAPEGDILKWMQRAASLEGVSLCPESAVCLGVMEKLLREGTLKDTDKILLFNTGASQKYPEACTLEPGRINLGKEIRWETLTSS